MTSYFKGRFFWKTFKGGTYAWTWGCWDYQGEGAALDIGLKRSCTLEVALVLGEL
jgi:hypothetical protein